MRNQTQPKQPTQATTTTTPTTSYVSQQTSTELTKAQNQISVLESERNQMRRIYNQGGKWATEIESNAYFNEEYTQSLE